MNAQPIGVVFQSSFSGASGQATLMSRRRRIIHDDIVTD